MSKSPWVKKPKVIRGVRWGRLSPLLFCGFFFWFGLIAESDTKASLEVLYYDSGEIKSEISYLLGQKQGLAKKYYPSGQLMEVATFVNGVLEGPWKWYYPSGQVMSEENYVHNKREGLSTSYYPSGEIWKTRSYVAGKQHGVVKEFYRRGALKRETHFDQGKKAGLETLYSPEQNILQKIQWHDDQSFDILIDQTKYVEGYTKKSYEVVINQIIRGSQAEKLGLQMGDVIISYQNKIVTSTEDLITRVQKNNQPAKLVVKRNNDLLSFQVNPGKIGISVQDR